MYLGRKSNKGTCFKVINLALSYFTVVIHVLQNSIHALRVLLKWITIRFIIFIPTFAHFSLKKKEYHSLAFTV